MARLDLPAGPDVKAGCSFPLRAQLVAVRWPVGVAGPGAPLRMALRVEAPEDGAARIRYTGAITDAEIPELPWSRLRVGLETQSTHTPEWSNPADSDPGRVSGETLLLDGGGSLDPDVARRLARSPGEFLVTVEARTPEGRVRFQGPGQADPLGPPGALRDPGDCF